MQISFACCTLRENPTVGTNDAASLRAQANVTRSRYTCKALAIGTTGGREAGKDSEDDCSLAAARYDPLIFAAGHA